MVGYQNSWFMTAETWYLSDIKLRQETTEQYVCSFPDSHFSHTLRVIRKQLFTYFLIGVSFCPHYFIRMMTSINTKSNLFTIKQDGRLAPAYFSPNKYFDEVLQTVKNKTTVLILVFKEFL